MKLRSKARYAVMAVCELAMKATESPVSLSEISQSQDLPLPFLEQIFNKLKRGQLVKSCRGAMGGYQLARSPEDISILDIIQTVDTPMKATRCQEGHSQGCHISGRRCLTHDLWHGLGETVNVFLKNVTVADVCQKRSFPVLQLSPQSVLLPSHETASTRIQPQNVSQASDREYA